MNVINIPISESTNYSIIGTDVFEIGDIVASGMPIHSKDDVFFKGYFGYKNEIKPISPYSVKDKYGLLLLQKPTEIKNPMTVESLVTLSAFDELLKKFGVGHPFKLESLIAEETLPFSDENCILRFGEINEVARFLLDYSELLNAEACKRIKNHENIDLELLKNDYHYGNNLISLAFICSLHSHPLNDQESNKRKSDLCKQNTILEYVNKLIIKKENLDEQIKLFELGHDEYCPSSWGELLSLVENKRKELGL